MSNGAQKHVNLALQGGGAHGAFTWGVLDALVADGRLAFDAISGTSAGAMNAVVLVDGFARGGAEGARARLAEFWQAVSREGGASPAGDAWARLMSFWQMPSPFAYLEPLAGRTSPYTANPLNINPLRATLAGLVDFERLATADRPRLFISATNVRNGKIRVFTGKEVTAEAVMASACLPFLFQAVEIGGEAYWDGGYMGNPALFPFFDDSGGSDDIVLVQVNPVRREEIPRTVNEIMERESEITFNASLLREFRAIDFVNRLIAEGRLDRKAYRQNRLHRIDATQALREYTAGTRLDTSWRFFQELHAAGVATAKKWLAKNYADIGVRATLDLRAEFL